MSREKQIEEMAKVMCGCFGTEKCYECRYCLDCHIKKQAEWLYNAGYRKQREGEWIKQKPKPEAMKAFHELGLGKGMSVNSIYWTCNLCGNWGMPHHKYCSNCGAKMKGGAE